MYRPGTSGTFNPSYTVTTNYLSGFHYEFNDNPNIVGNNGLIFFATAEGYVNVTLLRGGAYNYNYVYNYTDHLGNIRVSYTRGTGSNPPVILEENHYYPFGLKHKGYGFADPVPALAYQYKAQNKEFQSELGLNVHDFHFRQYMQDLGRTTTLDPKAEMFYSMSPYSFLNNSPLRFVDPTGMESEDFDSRDFDVKVDVGYGREVSVRQFTGAVGFSGASVQLNKNGEQKLDNNARNWLDKSGYDPDKKIGDVEHKSSYSHEMVARVDPLSWLYKDAGNPAIDYDSNLTYYGMYDEEKKCCKNRMEIICFRFHEFIFVLHHIT